jgi:hypothetical protein
MTDAISFNVDENIVKQAVQSQMTAAIAAELSKISPTIIDGIVAGVLNQKVQSDGKPSGSTYGNYPTMLRWLVDEAIKKAAQEAIAEWVETERPAIVSVLKNSIRKESGSMAEAFTNGLAESMKTKWSISINLVDPK